MPVETFTANGRSYRLPPRPAVVICIDGCADEYLSVSLARSRMPTLAVITRDGYRGFARAALPTFTNVNNAAIITGRPPAITGISGNFFLDPETGQEVMMNSPKYLRAETILAAAANAGRRVGVVTAKDKLREILGKNLGGIAFSSEKIGEARQATHGIEGYERRVGPQPPIYSAEASLWALRAGVALLEDGLADLLYISLTDYMQHKHPPEDPEALDFYGAIDVELGRLLAHDAILGITADHGMNAKCRADGTPNVIWLESFLGDRFGPGFRVICPITDPYVVHHGALGSAVWVHLAPGSDGARVARAILEIDGITEVLDRETAAEKLELPADRIGDLVVLAGRDVVIGRTPKHHDLSHLDGGLRSHGGRYEEMVPFIVSEPLGENYLARARGDVRNFDIFDFTLNGARGDR
jgi:phosphonoacetate hydrolase